MGATPCDTGRGAPPTRGPWAEVVGLPRPRPGTGLVVGPDPACQPDQPLRVVSTVKLCTEFPQSGGAGALPSGRGWAHGSAVGCGRRVRHASAGHGSVRTNGVATAGS